MPNLLDLDRDGDLDLLLTHAYNGGTSIWWNTANGFSATNDAVKFTAQNDTLVGRANAKDTLTGGGGNDVFVPDLTVNADGKYDVVTDFASGDKVRVDRAVVTGSKLTVSSLSQHNTNTDSNDATIEDTVITYLGADGVAGGTGVNADYVVMVLEDFTTTFDWGYFDFV